MSFHKVELSYPPFSPYVFIDTSEKWPSSLSAAGWTANGMKYIKLRPDTTAESLPDSMADLGNMMPVQAVEG
jgi:hypothetical protein